MTEAELIEWFEERAAIREYCGGYDRQRANFLAARDLKKEFGTVPDKIILVIRHGVKLEQQRTLFED